MIDINWLHIMASSKTMFFGSQDKPSQSVSTREEKRSSEAQLRNHASKICEHIDHCEILQAPLLPGHFRL